MQVSARSGHGQRPSLVASCECALQLSATLDGGRAHSIALSGQLSVQSATLR